MQDNQKTRTSASCTQRVQRTLLFNWNVSPHYSRFFFCILLLAAWVLLNLQRQSLVLLFDPLRLSLYPFCCGGATHFFRCIGDTTSTLQRGHCACVKTGRGNISAEFAVLTLTAHELGGREAAFSCQ